MQKIYAEVDLCSAQGVKQRPNSFGNDSCNVMLFLIYDRYAFGFPDKMLMK